MATASRRHEDSLPCSGRVTRGTKRRLESSAPDLRDTAATAIPKQHDEATSPGPSCDLCLHVQWTTAQGRTRVARLPLDRIAGVGDLRTLFRQLIRGAFPGGDDALPDYLTCPRYYKFAPSGDFVSLPGDAACTQFRLAARVGGFEATVAERQLGAPPDPQRNMLVTVAEFESPRVETGDGREVVATLVAYPAICVRREFLDAQLARLRAAAAERAAAAPSPSASQLAGDDASSAGASGSGSGSGSGGREVALGVACSLSC